MYVCMLFFFSHFVAVVIHLLDWRSAGVDSRSLSLFRFFPSFFILERKISPPFIFPSSSSLRPPPNIIIIFFFIYMFYFLSLFHLLRWKCRSSDSPSGDDRDDLCNIPPHAVLHFDSFRRQAAPSPSSPREICLFFLSKQQNQT